MLDAVWHSFLVQSMLVSGRHRALTQACTQCSNAKARTKTDTVVPGKPIFRMTFFFFCHRYDH